MSNLQDTLKNNTDKVKDLIGNNSELIIRNIMVGKITPIKVAIMYINGLVKTEVIDKDILKPLMFHVQEELTNIGNIEEYMCEKYIAISNVHIEEDVNKAVEGIKRGKAVVSINGACSFIIADTTGGEYRTISDPENETSVRGARDGFVERLETNISILKRRIKDKNLMTEKFTLGRRSQTDLVIMYIDDIVDKELLEKVRNRIKAIDVDNVQDSNIIVQLLEKHPLSIFPQAISTERPDRVQANLMEGRIAVILQETPFVITFPTLFVEFFQSVEDYYYRTIISSFIRLIRYLCVIIIIALPAVYISFIKFNQELIPVEFVKSLVQSRKGIALTPFMSILSMNLMVEFLREGGIRLPGKVGQTLSVVGGIIIGDAALKAKIVSSSTLLVVGITTTATFMIPNYAMSLSIRFLSIPTLILGNWLGMMGVSISMVFILTYLCSLDSFGVPYFSFKKGDLKDTIIRAPIWMMDKNPESIPNNNHIRQSNFRWKFRRRKNG